MERPCCRGNSWVRSRIRDRGHQNVRHVGPIIGKRVSDTSANTCRIPFFQLLLKQILISLHTFANSAPGASNSDTPIEDQTWSGRVVERIRGSDRRSSIGVVDFTAGNTHTHSRTSPPSKPSRWIPACEIGSLAHAY